MAKNKILVPVEFSEISDAAIDYSIAFAKATKYEINLLHVIEKPVMYIGKRSKSNDQLIEEATVSRLQKIADTIEEQHGVEVDIIAVTGNIFDTINSVARQTKAKFVVMGIQSPKSMRSWRGSDALKVVYHSTIPFILVQSGREKPHGFETMTFPIDYQTETRDKTVAAAYFAKSFGTRINILYQRENDKRLAKKVNSNLIFIKKMFDSHGVKYSVEAFDKGSTDLSDKTVKYSQELNDDIIMIMIYPEQGAGEFFLTPSQLKVIANEAKIPVVCINPSIVF